MVFYPWIFHLTAVHINREKKIHSSEFIIKGDKIMSEKIQIIRMCIQTYINLYGKKPTVKELSQQLNSSYLQLIQMTLSDYAVA